VPEPERPQQNVSRLEITGETLMAELKRVVVGLGVVLGVAALLYGQTTVKGPNSTAASPRPAKAEPYRDLTTKDHLICKAKNISLHGNPSETASISGKIQSFGCEDKGGKIRLIELKSTSVVDSMLQTRDFGTIRISNVMDEDGMTFAIQDVTASEWKALTFFMKESQIKKLQAYLGF
jgi:hypothetical protein